MPVSKKFVIGMVALVLFLGFGGEIGQHFFETYGKAPTVTAPTSPILNETTTTNPSTPTLISLETFMNVKFIGAAVAPTFSLTTQLDKKWNLAAQKGKVVVLTFYNSICNDVCAVLGPEIRAARRDLGSRRSKVEFAIVNTDPRRTLVSTQSKAVQVTGLSTNPSAVFLTGDLKDLDAVWTSYGVKVKVGAKMNQVSHNNVLYFIGPSGNLEALATPFAIESKTGTFSWNTPSMRLYAQGIAETADSLVQ
ncbi:MAG TPA: SCO family protein [Acidimicrobiales bacterium]|nr:SCO family protein [Acidimicrobiales bacterium]